MQMIDCVFCKIIEGKASCQKLYEDERTLCILDIGQTFSDTGEIIPGRSLVIPKRHTTWFYDLEDEEAGQLFITAKKVASKIKKAFNPDFVTVIVRGQQISHAHIILQPSGEDDAIGRLFAGLRSSFKLASKEQLDNIARKIREN